MMNRDDLVFVKRVQRSQRHYSLSRVFAPLISSQELYSVLQILQRLSQKMGDPARFNQG